MYCIPVLAQRRREFYTTATSRFFTYRGGVWNALTAISERTLYTFFDRNVFISATLLKLCNLINFCVLGAMQVFKKSVKNYPFFDFI